MRLYQDRALITRRAEVNVDAGSQILTFEHLPAATVGDSIRAGGKGTASVRITGSEFKKNILKSAPEENVKVLQDEIQSLQDEV